MITARRFKAFASSSRARAALIAVVLAMVFAQAGSDAQTGALTPSPLPYSTSYLLTGDFTIGSVDITSGSQLSATATIPMSGVPANADILAAFLYWETIAPSIFTPDQIADYVKFRDQPIKSVRVKSTGKQLTGNTGQCFTAAGLVTLTEFRADVLRLLPPQKDANGKPTGKLLVNDADLLLNGLPLNTVTLPEAGTANVVPQSAGASLVVVYRDPSLPLRKIVVYDGLYIQPQGETTIQEIAGFYKSAGKQARLAHLLAAGANNTTEQLYFNNQLVATNPFPGTSKSSDRAWAGVTFDVGSKMPGTDANDGFGERVESKVTHTKSTPYECLTWAATWFSTNELDADHDGIPDKLEESLTPLKDPNGATLPDIHAMEGSLPPGQSAKHKDVLIEVNAMYTAQDTTYGSATAPYGKVAATPPMPPPWAKAFSQSGDVVTDVTAGPHNHMPISEVVKGVGDVYRNAPVPNLDGTTGIRAHFDVGDIAVYHALGAEYAKSAGFGPSVVGGSDDYFVPSGVARGGELINESDVKCAAGTANCQFPDYPGTVGWGLSLEKLTLKYLDKNRNGLVHYVLYGHSRGRPKSFPCLDAFGTPALFETNGTCAVTPNPDFVPADYHVPSSSSGVSDLPGFRAVVTLGRWENFVGTTFVRISTTVHELTHNFEIWHGGAKPSYTYTPAGTVLAKVVEPNCKPNYQSVMSYLFQLSGLLDEFGVAHTNLSDRINATIGEPSLKDGTILPEGSVGTLPYRGAWYAPLGNGTLVDTLGLPAATKLCNGLKLPAGVSMARYDAPTASSNIDWKTNGFVLDQSAADQDVNLDNADNSSLTGFNDWSALQDGGLNQIGGGHVVGDVSNGGQDFGGQDFGGQDFGGQDFGGQDFGGQDFGGQDFGGQDFGGQDFDGQDFGGQDFGGQDFGGDAELTYETAVGIVSNPPNQLAACVLGGTTGAPLGSPGTPACTDATTPLHRVRLTWTPPHVGVAVRYLVYRTAGDTITPSSTPQLVCNTPNDPASAGYPACPDGTTTNFIDTQELPNGQPFTYFVKADFTADGTDHSPASNFATIWARNDPALAANDNPPAAHDDRYVVNEDTTLIVAAPGVLSNDTDPDSPLGPIVVTQQPGNAAPGSFSYSPNGSFTYRPKQDFYGIDTFKYKIQAGTFNGVPMSADSNEATVTIVINPVNDAPSFARGANDSVLEDSGARTLANWATAISAGPANETNGSCDPLVASVCQQTLTFHVSNDNLTLFSAPPAIDAVTGTLTYTPAPDANGSAIVTVTLQDTGGLANGGVDASAPQTFTISVTAVNDAPSFTKGADQTVAEDSGPHSVPNWATGFSPGPADEAGQTVLAYHIVGNSNPSLFSSGPAVANDGTLTFQSAPDANGVATIQVTVQDTGGVANSGVDTSTPRTFMITVTEVNDPPVPEDDFKQMNEDCSATAAASCASPMTFAATELLTNDTAGPTNESGQTLTVTSVTATELTNGSVSLTDGTISYTPNANYHGLASFAYEICDNGTTAGVAAPLCATGLVKITINSVNDNPVAVDDATVTRRDTAVTINVVGNDTDVDGDTLSVQSATDPSHGTKVVNGDSTITYTPNASFFGTDTFDYTLSDGQGGTATGHVRIIVGGNSAVVANRNDNSVSLIDLSNNTVTATLGLGAAPRGSTLTPDGQMGLVPEFAGQGIIRRIDVVSQPPAVLPDSIVVNAIPNPESIAITPDGRFAIVSDGSPESDLASVDLQQRTVVSTISGVPGNQGAAITPDGQLVLVIAADVNKVGVFTLSSSGILSDTGQRIGLAGITSGPRSIAITPNGQVALVTNTGDTNTGGLVSVLAISGQTVTFAGSISNLGTATSGLAIARDGSKAYVSSYGSADLAILSISAGNVVTDTGTRIAVPNGTPATFFGVPGIAITPDGSRLFISGFDTGKISILDTATDTLLSTTITVGSGPAGIGMPAQR